MLLIVRGYSLMADPANEVIPKMLKYFDKGQNRGTPGELIASKNK